MPTINAVIILLVVATLLGLFYSHNLGDPLNSRDSGPIDVMDVLVVWVYGFACIAVIWTLVIVAVDLWESFWLWNRTKSPWAVRAQRKAAESERARKLSHVIEEFPEVIEAIKEFRSDIWEIRSDISGTRSELDEMRSSSQGPDASDAEGRESKKRLKARKRMKERLRALEEERLDAEIQRAQDGKSK